MDTVNYATRTGDRKRPVVLVFLGYYVPGFKAGGILTCVLNIVNHLHGDFQFLIVTRDRDLGDLAPYPNITPQTWQKVGNAHVYYLPRGSESVANLRRLIRETPHDAIYLNSVFDPLTVKVLFIRKLGLLKTRPIVVTPHGEFAWPALRQKYIKKIAFLRLARLGGLYRGVTWHASGSLEALDMARVMKIPREAIRVALQLPPSVDDAVEESIGRVAAPSGEAIRVVFLSRISPGKNLHFALKVLARVRANVSFDIIGPIENAAYWAECQPLIRALPGNVSVRSLGPIRPSDVITTLAEYDLMLFPSGSESYGQVIAESLVAGTPVLISTNTPWRDLQAKGVGWDLPLNDPEPFARVLDEVAAASHEERSERRMAVRQKVRQLLADSTAVSDIRRLFNSVIEQQA